MGQHSEEQTHASCLHRRALHEVRTKLQFGGCNCLLSWSLALSCQVSRGLQYPDHCVCRLTGLLAYSPIPSDDQSATAFTAREAFRCLPFTLETLSRVRLSVQTLESKVQSKDHAFIQRFITILSTRTLTKKTVH